MNRDNLQKLATFLYYGKAPVGVEFNMRRFSTDCQLLPTCNTSGCAVGWAPFAGITKRTDENFLDYSCRTLIDFDSERRNWDWCFDDNWDEYDPTREAAAKRIQYLLDNGLPERFNTVEMEDFVSVYANTEVKRGRSIDLYTFFQSLSNPAADPHELAKDAHELGVTNQMIDEHRAKREQEVCF